MVYHWKSLRSYVHVYQTGGVEELDTPNETPVIKYTVYCTALFMNPFNFGLSIYSARPEYVLIGVYYINYQK
jgi:hypothetical protein